MPVGMGDNVEQKQLFKVGNEMFLNQNYQEAIVYLKKAAGSLLEGYPCACGVLGFIYEFGLGLKVDFIMAEKYYMLGAKGNDGLALCRLAFLRHYGRPSIVIDRAEADELKTAANKLGRDCVAWLEDAAVNHNIPSANYAFGVCFHDGVGVEKCPETALKYYKIAAEQGDVRAEGALGYCYGEGFGIEKNQVKAFEYYKSSADKGENVSMYNVGYCYEQGLTVNRSFTEAIKWYKKSAALGNCYAQNSLGYL